MIQRKINQFVEREINNISLEAYERIKSKLGERQILIFDFIKKNPDLTAYEICHKLGYSDPNRVRPRINELVKFGFVFSPFVRVCNVTGYKANIWRVADNKQ